MQMGNGATDIPQRDMAATHVYESGENLGDSLGNILAEHFWTFSSFRLTVTPE